MITLPDGTEFAENIEIWIKVDHCCHLDTKFEIDISKNGEKKGGVPLLLLSGILRFLTRTSYSFCLHTNTTITQMSSESLKLSV